MPSSTAAFVACIASSTRAFFSFISVSVAAPTLITATPPTSFEPFLELLAVVVGRRVFDLRADLLDAAFDGLVAARALDDRRVVLVDRDLLRLAEIFDLDVL